MLLFSRVEKYFDMEDWKKEHCLQLKLPLHSTYTVYNTDKLFIYVSVRLSERIKPESFCLLFQLKQSVRVDWTGMRPPHNESRPTWKAESRGDVITAKVTNNQTYTVVSKLCYTWYYAGDAYLMSQFFFFGLAFAEADLMSPFLTTNNYDPKFRQHLETFRHQKTQSELQFVLFVASLS